MEQAACNYCGAPSLGSAYNCLRCGAAQSVPLSNFNPRAALASAESPEIRGLRTELERVTRERDALLEREDSDNESLRELIAQSTQITEALTHRICRHQTVRNALSGLRETVIAIGLSGEYHELDKALTAAKDALK